MAVFNDQIRSPTKVKKEKLTILNTYAFTINQVPHVFGEHYFAGHKHKYIPTLICTKEQGRCPSNQFKQRKTPRECNPGLAHGLPGEGGGEKP